MTTPATALNHRSLTHNRPLAAVPRPIRAVPAPEPGGGPATITIELRVDSDNGGQLTDLAGRLGSTVASLAARELNGRAGGDIRANVSVRRDRPAPVSQRPTPLSQRGGSPHAVAVTGDEAVVIDVPRREVTVSGRAVRLTRLEFELLAFLIRHHRQVFTRAQLLTSVWGYEVPAGERTVDVHVRRLRAKLTGAGIGITTVHGVGYRLEDPRGIRLVDDEPRNPRTTA